MNGGRQRLQWSLLERNHPILSSNRDLDYDSKAARRGNTSEEPGLEHSDGWEPTAVLSSAMISPDIHMHEGKTRSKPCEL